MSRLRLFRTSGILFLCILFSTAPFAQSVTGIWRGYFIQDDGEQYKLEFQIKQTSDGSYVVNGVSYSYLDVRFYGKASMTGSYARQAKQLRIKEIRTVEVKSTTGGGVCIMNYNLSLVKSGNEYFLEGSYLGKPETKGQINTYEWGDCGAGKVYLRKVETSDFYVEPFLRNNPITRAPVKKPPTTTTKPPEVKKDVPPPVVKKTEPNLEPTVKEKDPEVKIIEPVKPPVVKRNEIPVPPAIKNRENQLFKSLVVKTRKVQVRLYDNGEIDGDTISVYLNNRLVISNQRLTATAITVNLDMEDDGDQELVMVAENLGSIPPNTSLMIVESGEQRYEVRITSTEQKNAVVRFKYQP